jgi:hypothetical protein
MTGGCVHRTTTEQEKIHLKKDTGTVGRNEEGHRMTMVEPKMGLVQGTTMVGQVEGSVHKKTMEELAKTNSLDLRSFSSCIQDNRQVARHCRLMIYAENLPELPSRIRDNPQVDLQCLWMAYALLVVEMRWVA